MYKEAPHARSNLRAQLRLRRMHGAYQMAHTNSVTEDKRARDLRDCLLDMIIKCEHKYISTVTVIVLVLTTPGQAKYTRKMLSGQRVRR